LMPEPTAAHILAMDNLLIEEWVNATKLILDSENSHRIKGQVMAMETTHCIEDHQINVMCKLVIGNFMPTSL
jgi:hypothetical protein